MTRLNASGACNTFATTLNRVAFAKDRVVLERDGKPLRALVAVKDLELLQRLEDRIDLEAARKALKQPGRILLPHALRHPRPRRQSSTYGWTWRQRPPRLRLPLLA